MIRNDGDAESDNASSDHVVLGMIAWQKVCFSKCAVPFTWGLRRYKCAYICTAFLYRIESCQLAIYARIFIEALHT